MTAPEETPQQRKEAIQETAGLIMRRLRNFEINEGAQAAAADLGAFYRRLHPGSALDFGQRFLSLRALCQPLCEHPDELADSGEKIFMQALALAETLGELVVFDPTYDLKSETRGEITAFKAVPSPGNMVNMVYSIGRDRRPAQAPDPFKDIVFCLARLSKRWVLMNEESKGRTGFP